MCTWLLITFTIPISRDFVSYIHWNSGMENVWHSQVPAFQQNKCYVAEED